MTIARSVVLLTSAAKGVRDCGTGFVVRTDNSGTYVVTCQHVVDDLRQSGEGLLVDGHRSEFVDSGIDEGIDLAVLRVDRPLATPVSVLSTSDQSVARGKKLHGYGFHHLHGSHFVRSRFDATTGSPLAIRGQAVTAEASDAIQLRAGRGTPVRRGYSGSPVAATTSGGVVGVMAFASQDGRVGYALSISALRRFWSPARTGGESESPPEPGEITDPSDLQRGRFGGHQSDGKVRLSASLGRVFGTSSFRFDARVAPEPGEPRLIGPARFFLHDTFPRSVIWIRRADADGGFRLREVYSYGVFVLGCQVRDEQGVWHMVEYDLRDLAGLADVFQSGEWERPLSFERLGFERSRLIGKHKWVVTLTAGPGSSGS